MGRGAGFPSSWAWAFLALASLLYLDTSLIKWKAPIILPWSVSATAGICAWAVALTKSAIEAVDCKTENWVWLCRCAKGAVSSRARFSASSVEDRAVDSSWALSFSEAAFRLICCNPQSATGAVYFSWISAIASWETWLEVKPSPRRTSSKKQRAVASTSAVALWASAKGVPKRNWWSSVRLGYLNLPTLPPSIRQSSAVISVQVSKTGSSPKRVATP